MQSLPPILSSVRAKFAYRHYLRHPWQLVLGVAGISLGVAIVLAIDLTNTSASRGFDIANQSVAGDISHQIFGGSRTFDEEIYRALRADHGIYQISPWVEGELSLRHADQDHRLRIAGMDPLALMRRQSGREDGARGRSGVYEFGFRLIHDPGTVVMLSSAARRAGISEPGEFEYYRGDTRGTLRVIAIIPDEDYPAPAAMENTLVGDIASAQELLGLEGRLSRIDAWLTEGQAEIVERLLPTDLQLESSGARGNAMQQMTRAFQINLTALGLLALLIGAFLIYNTMTLSVLQRRPRIAVVRTLGLTRRELLIMVLSEAMVIGILGTLLGSAGGIWLSKMLVSLASRTLNDLYFASEVQAVTWSAWSMAKATMLGLGATVAASILPANEAARTPPTVTQSRSALEISTRLRSRALMLTGLALAIGAAMVLMLSGRSIIAGFFGLFMVVMAFAVMTPALLVLLVGLATPVMRSLFGLLGGVGARDVLSSLSRTQVAVAALAISISATVGVALMISSFRGSVEEWLDSFLRADIYISAQRGEARSALSPELVEQIRQRPGVDSVSTLHARRIWREEELVRVNVIDLDEQVFANFQFLDGAVSDRWQQFSSENSVIVSEPWAYRHNTRTGDRITLPTPGDDSEDKTLFTVTGVFRDYSSDQGIITIHTDTWDRHWPAADPPSLGIYLDPAVDATDFRQSLETELLDGAGLSARDNRSLKRFSLEIFDRSFAITDVLRVLTVIIAFIGILGALMAIQLERHREFAVLRAIGLTTRDLRRLLLIEGGLMGLAAGILAVPLGVALSWLLIFVINRRSFGWSMEFIVDPGYLLSALLLGLLAGLAASLYPAWYMSRTTPAAALRHE